MTLWKYYYSIILYYNTRNRVKYINNRHVSPYSVVKL